MLFLTGCQLFRTLITFSIMPKAKSIGLANLPNPENIDLRLLTSDKLIAPTKGAASKYIARKRAEPITNKINIGAAKNVTKRYTGRAASTDAKSIFPEALKSALTPNFFQVKYNPTKVLGRAAKGRPRMIPTMPIVGTNRKATGIDTIKLRTLNFKRSFVSPIADKRLVIVRNPVNESR